MLPYSIYKLYYLYIYAEYFINSKRYRVTELQAQIVPQTTMIWSSIGQIQ